MTNVHFPAETLEEEIQTLNKALGALRPYDNFLDDVESLISGYQSEFTRNLKNTVHNMSDSKAPEMAKKMESLIHQLESIKLSAVELDHNIDQGLIE